MGAIIDMDLLLIIGPAKSGLYGLRKYITMLASLTLIYIH